MPGPLTKSVCVLYLTFSRANSMLCLPSARRELGAASRQGRQRGLPRRAPPPGADACEAAGSGDGQAWLTRESGSALPCPSPARLRAGAVALQACGDRGGLRGRARQAPACTHCARAALARAAACGALCRGDPGLWHLMSLQHTGTWELCRAWGTPHRAQLWVLTPL